MKQTWFGVTPLIDSVPIENFILSVLHIIIGMGNSLISSFLEWVEERVEKLLPNEVEARNRVLYATLQLSSANTDYESWLQNGGILLTDIQLEKKQMKDILNERVSFILLICIYNHNMIGP